MADKKKPPSDNARPASRSLSFSYCALVVFPNKHSINQITTNQLTHSEAGAFGAPRGGATAVSVYSAAKQTVG